MLPGKDGLALLQKQSFSMRSREGPASSLIFAEKLQKETLQGLSQEHLQEMLLSNICFSVSV